MVPGVILKAAPAASSNCTAQRSGTAVDCMRYDTAKAVYNIQYQIILISLIGILE